jgi:general secretion pathway protein A
MNDLILDHFQLKRYPFGPEIDPDALYLFHSFQQGLLRLEQGCRQRGMFVLAAEPGAGKNTLARHLRSRLAPSSFHCLDVAVPNKNPLRAVVEGLLTKLGEPLPFNNVTRCLTVLQAALVKLWAQSQVPVIFLDDSHHLDCSGWLALKTLTNYEMDSRVPFLLVLMGKRQEMTDTLRLSRLDEIRDRLLCCYHLRGLTPQEIEPYLDAHLRWAGRDRGALFPREIAQELHRRSNGLPRRVNRLAFGCLTAAAHDRRELIDYPCLEQACSELQLFSERDTNERK